MERYVGLDVSLKLTSICVVNQTGSIVQEGVVDSDPEAIAAFVLDLRPPSQRARLPAPVTAKAGPMPTHEGLGMNDRNGLEDRRKPAIQLDKEPSIINRESDAAAYLAPQNDQLMSKRCVLSFKPKLRLE
jgi:hypothetical protein